MQAGGSQDGVVPAVGQLAVEQDVVPYRGSADPGGLGHVSNHQVLLPTHCRHTQRVADKGSLTRVHACTQGTPTVHTHTQRVTDKG
jgi:hypothetical protein